MAGRDAESLARTHGTPTYVYDLTRIQEQAEALRAALLGAGLRGIVRLAIKAQRDEKVLAFLRERCPWVGADVCSPGEAEWALRLGWPASEVSFTGTNLSERDLDVVFETGAHLNVDLLSQVARVGRRAPGSSIGVRLNPRGGASYSGGEESKYAGQRPTKFGVLQEQLPELMKLVARHGLSIDTVHVHVGDGYLNDSLPAFSRAMGRVAEMTRVLQESGCPIGEVNTGGGLGVPYAVADRPLDLDRWAEILAEHLGPLDVVISTEPGDFLAKECGVLLAEVVTLEDREGTVFAGLDAGWNQACEHFVYGDPLEVVPCTGLDVDARRVVTVAGNINEGDDLFAEHRALPPFGEGEILAILGVGAYGASMWSEHCMRPPAGSLAFADRSSA